MKTFETYIDRLSCFVLISNIFIILIANRIILITTDQILIKRAIIAHMLIARLNQMSYPLLKFGEIAPFCRASKGLSNDIQFKVDRYFHNTIWWELYHRRLHTVYTSELCHRNKKRENNNFPDVYISFDRGKEELSFGI